METGQGADKSIDLVVQELEQACSDLEDDLARLKADYLKFSFGLGEKMAGIISRITKIEARLDPGSLEMRK